MRIQTLLIPLLVVLTLVAAALALAPTHSSAHADLTTASVAPAFTLTDIYGHPFNLSSATSTDVVVIEFTALSCSECQVVEKSLASLYANYNQSGTTSVRIVSVYIEPSFGDTIPALQAYHTKNAITWTMAQDTPSLAVSTSYGVNAIPDVVVVDKHQQVVYDVSGVQDSGKLQSTISSANAGTAKAITLVTVSVFALAAVAGVTTFFSPCAFPMFPGYMSLFLGLNASSAPSQPSGAATYKGTARRALFAGSVTAAGMIVVFLIIGVALIYAASLIGGYIPYLLIVVGVILVGLGVLLLTNLQYWKIVTPLQRLWARARGQKPAGAEVPAVGASGKGFYVKLFSYGTGYAAAAAGCVAPVIFSAIIAGLALGLLGGLISILIYSLTAALLMIVVTVMLAVAGKKYVNQLKAFTPVIKKISAGVLILVGFYLIYFFYTAWGF
ncbi:MAG: redoxin domain-containing protein [Thermoplasmata archaeon]|nr:redoxin domain-containing protein [Thermoplasmata archaeon]